MDRGTMLGILAAPIIAPALWWVFTRPGLWLHNFLWKRLPDGKLRRVLLGRVSDKWLPMDMKDPNP